MSKVLIVDENQNELNELKKKLDQLHQFEVLVSSDGAEAVETLAMETVSVFITNTRVPQMDGLELIAYMTQNYPLTPCIVITTYAKPWFHVHKTQQECLYHLQKPFEIWALVSAIMVALNLRDEGLTDRGISMSSILPLIEMEQKTCRMEITSREKGKGFLYFLDGKLIDAHFKQITGENAALNISQWNRVSIKFADLPERRKRSRVKTSLMEFAGAIWRKDMPQQGAVEDAADVTLNLKPPAAEDKNIKAVLEAHSNEFRAVRGYLAVGILDNDGGVLADDIADTTIQLEHIVSALSQQIDTTMKLMDQNGLGDCQTITLHTASITIMIIIADLATEGPVKVVALTRADGNWFYLKVRLEKMLSNLLK